jgi:hypothetical protein
MTGALASPSGCITPGRFPRTVLGRLVMKIVPPICPAFASYLTDFTVSTLSDLVEVT